MNMFMKALSHPRLARWRTEKLGVENTERNGDLKIFQLIRSL